MIATDILRRHDAGRAKDMATRARTLLGPQSRYSERIMFAQLASFRDAFDDVIAALDGHVSTAQPTEPLSWLAWAFANSPPRPRTHLFFSSLPNDILALGNFARLAGVAESIRGDLRSAERHFRRALGASPDDLRAHLHLHSVLERDGRRSEAAKHILAIDENVIHGSADDKMRLAFLLRHQGESARALALGYATVMAARNDVDAVTIYPGLFFCREDVPEGVARFDGIGPDMWFDLQGDDVPDVQGIIESKQSDNPFLFPPDHPLASAVIGKGKGDEVELRPEMGPVRRYIVRDIKHKYVWLLHDIMATHATHFPESTSMFEMSIKDGDVQPVLDYVRELSDRSKAITQSYTDLAIPLSAVAAMSRKSVIEFSEHLVQSGISLHTCLGSAQERTEAIRFAADACRQGAILDTLTAWNAFRLGLLPELKAHFGRLLVPRSSIDEIVELRGKEEVNRGRETMTLGYEGDQAVRDVRSPEDVERVIGIYDRALADLQTHCEIMPSDGSDDLQFDDDRVAWIAVAKILDPIYLARSTGMLLLSEDLRLRQLAGHAGAANGAWLQAALRAMVGSAEPALSQPQYLTAVGQLAALRHEHIWLDVPTLYGLLTLDDTRAETLFDCAASYIGCENAEMGSHVGVVLDFMCIAWNAQIPSWRQGRAIGKLLNNLIRHRRSDWRDVLLVMNRELRARSSTSHGAIRGQEYLQQWCHGHFLGIDFADAAGLGQGIRRQLRRSKRERD